MTIENSLKTHLLIHFTSPLTFPFDQLPHTPTQRIPSETTTEEVSK